MYCRNCGSEVAENAVVCVKCGVARGAASNFCPNCGSETNRDASVCINCGVALKAVAKSGLNSDEKTKMAAGLLAIFLGHIGMHEFYLGFNKKAKPRIILTVAAVVLYILGKVLWLLGGSFLKTVGILILLGVLVWNIFDAVNIFKGKRTDADGNELA
ncbi:MAG: TM2 domain-containing protein [Clostridia bacterium]|nr:TM2 domain-containing protein [Clostridia bacterium]